ncbi:MAG: hypothetical protein ACKOZM_04705, partial [Flavobacteriales bacterium]
MKKFLSLLLVIEILASCSIERRRYLPGFHIEGRSAKCEVRGAKCEVQGARGEVRRIENESINAAEPTKPDEEFATISERLNTPTQSPSAKRISDESSPPSHLAPRTSHLALRTTPLEPDTLKKPFKPQKQYREVDPVGKASVIVVLVGVSLQKVAEILTWFEVIMPLSFG